MKQHLVGFAWTLSAITVVVSFLAWFSHLALTWPQFSLYHVFPLFGLIAFGLMWSHYIIGAAWKYYGVEREKLNTYYSFTSYVVLVSILLHPGLLMGQLWRDGLGLPLDYVTPQLKLYLVCGVVAWLAFILYETHRLFADRSAWKYVRAASDGAMILILVHGYKLSSEMMPDWFIVVWVTYGVTLVASMAYSYSHRLKNTPEVAP